MKLFVKLKVEFLEPCMNILCKIGNLWTRSSYFINNLTHTKKNYIKR